jgi:predicted nuclease of predicted toxin-antitoxin system
MILIADEGVDVQVVAALRRGGYDVTFVAELAPGISDQAVLDLARDRRALLVTTDKDFGELVVRQRRAVGGVVLLRFAGLAPEARAALVSAVVESHAGRFAGSFAVLTPRSVRFRRLG